MFEIFKEFMLWNWATVLILVAFVVLLKTTVFLERKTVRRYYWLIGIIFVLSIIVFTEFYLNDRQELVNVRLVLMALRYTSTPLIISLILFALVKKARWYVFIPTIVLGIINIISIFTGIVFGIDENDNLVRGVLGYLPYIAVGLYSFFLVFILVRQSNKQISEIVPIIFLVFAFASGLVLPFILKGDYSKLFCPTIVISLFVYYVFSVIQITKKDPLTGLFNRQAYYVAIKDNAKDITALVSIDMNGLKEVNDKYGHIAGDEALVSLSLSFLKATKAKQTIYRMGGDEFVIICRKTDENEVIELVKRIEKNVLETKFHCAIGYSCLSENVKDIDTMLKKSDEMMYSNKAKYYSQASKDRRV